MNAIVRFLEKTLRLLAPSFIEKRPGLMQFARFSIVGALGAVVDFGCYSILTRAIGLPPLASNFVSVFLAILTTYTFNKFWTFRSLEKKVIPVEGAKFFIVSTINYILQQLIFVGIINYTHLEIYVGKNEDFLAKVIAIAIILFSNFFANKYWTFRAQLEKGKKSAAGKNKNDREKDCLTSENEK